MATERKDNPITSLSEFYIGQMEQMAPKLKQAIEDWFAFHNKLWNEGIKLQEDWIKQFTNAKENTTEFSKQSRSFVQKVMNIQKDVSTNVVDLFMQGVQSLKKSQEKNTTTK